MKMSHNTCGNRNRSGDQEVDVVATYEVLGHFDNGPRQARFAVVVTAVL
jgi:hypothetical protein